MAIEQTRLTKSQLIESFEELPEEANVEDFIDHLAFILGVEEGLADIAAGRTITHQQLLERMKRWRK